MNQQKRKREKERERGRERTIFVCVNCLHPFIQIENVGEKTLFSSGCLIKGCNSQLPLFPSFFCSYFREREVRRERETNQGEGNKKNFQEIILVDVTFLQTQRMRFFQREMKRERERGGGIESRVLT